MLFATLLVYLSYLVIGLFALVCLASGLYCMAEWVEEYTVLTKKIIRYIIWSVIGIHVVLLFVEDFPITYIFIGLVAHGVYYSLLSTFPFTEIKDPKFIGSCVMAAVDHSLWFYYFTQYYYPFNEIFAFFIILVWLVPFTFFLSLTANDNTLPGLHTPALRGEQQKKTKRGFNLLGAFKIFGEKGMQVMQNADPYSATIKIS